MSITHGHVSSAVSGPGKSSTHRSAPARQELFSLRFIDLRPEDPIYTAIGNDIFAALPETDRQAGQICSAEGGGLYI